MHIVIAVVTYKHVFIGTKYFLHLTLIVDIRVRFTQEQYTDSEATGFVMVTLELVNGISNNPFSIAVTPSEQSPVSAEGNSVMCMIRC